MTNLALMGLLLSLLGWASYIPVSKTPALRHNMWPMWAMLFISVVLAAVAVAGCQPLTSVVGGLAGATLALFFLFVAAYFAALRVPRSAGRPEIGKLLPSFSVVAENGQNISPDHYVGKGPLLLVFFRGFW
jgi:tellurite resistance protein TehA-like permease